MAYSTYINVQSEFRDITFEITGGAIIQSEVTNIIAEEDAVIDAKLSTKYITPITATASLPILRKISVYMTAGRIWQILNQVTDGTKDRGADLINRGNSMISKILSIGTDELKLPNAVLASSTNIVASNYDNGIEPVFKKDEQQW